MSLTPNKKGEKESFWDTDFGTELLDAIVAGGLILVAVLGIALYIGLIALTAWLYSIGSGFAILTTIVAVLIGFLAIGWIFKDWI